MTPKLWWYIARAGGLTAWWLVALAVFWGLLLSTRVMRGKPTPAWLLDLHRFLGASAIIFTGAHVGGLVADNWTHFGWSEVFVPLTSSWRPVAVAWGVIGLYLLAAIEITSLLMRRIPRRWWRAVHSTSFVLFVLSTVHAFSAGTDATNTAVQWTGLSFAGIFVFLMVYRAMIPKKGARARPATKAPADAPANAAT